MSKQWRESTMTGLHVFPTGSATTPSATVMFAAVRGSQGNGIINEIPLGLEVSRVAASTSHQLSPTSTCCGIPETLIARSLLGESRIAQVAGCAHGQDTVTMALVGIAGLRVELHRSRTAAHTINAMPGRLVAHHAPRYGAGKRTCHCQLLCHISP